MHRLLDNTLRSIRQDLDLHLDADFIHRVCREIGHSWRSRTLPPVPLIHWLLHQVLAANTALQHLSLRSDRAFTASALCQARKRLPRPLLAAILKALATSSSDPDEAQGRWKGHRTFLTDGSSFSMPDTPELQQHFGRHKGQKPGCGFPTAKFLVMFDAQSGRLVHLEAAPLRTHEMSQVARLHPALQTEDVLVGDRGFCSFAHLALLAARGAHAVFRIHQKQIVDFPANRPHAQGQKGTGLPHSRWVEASGPDDQTVEWQRPAQRPSWMTAEEFAALPEVLRVREVRYKVSAKGSRTRWVTLVTTLLDRQKYPREDLAELYGVRWRVEQNLRDLKQTLGMDVLKCQSVEGVLKEVMAFAIAYNLVRIVMGEAGRRQRVSADRISFVDALRWLSEASAGDRLPPLVVNPLRPDRFEPRVRKRRPKSYPLMTKPRQLLREHLITQHVTA